MYVCVDVLHAHGYDVNVCLCVSGPGVWVVVMELFNYSKLNLKA